MTAHSLSSFQDVTRLGQANAGDTEQRDISVPSFHLIWLHMKTGFSIQLHQNQIISELFSFLFNNRIVLVYYFLSTVTSFGELVPQGESDFTVTILTLEAEVQSGFSINYECLSVSTNVNDYKSLPPNLDVISC